MKRSHPSSGPSSRRGSILVIVLWITFGLVSIALYFADSMSCELRASDHRASCLVADQAIEGACRYVSRLLSTLATNGVVPSTNDYLCVEVPVGEAHFWMIGRDTSGIPLQEPVFGLVDEASKLNLNYADTNSLFLLPNMSSDLALAIADWRSTNGTSSFAMSYAQRNYSTKSAPFETVEELRLVYGATAELLEGDDLNHNGILDENEIDLNGNGTVEAGLLDDFTVYSREPNTGADGMILTNINNEAQLEPLLAAKFGDTRADQIMTNLVLSGGSEKCSSLLQFFIRSGMSADEFSLVADEITVGTASYIYGRVNVNTAGPVVLACLPGLTADDVQKIINYRLSNPDRLANISWLVEALGGGNAAVRVLAQGDRVTTRSYQYTADIAAVGPFGRGYRRTRFVFDLSTGSVQVVYRQDLSRLGWALGMDVRNRWPLKAVL